MVEIGHSWIFILFNKLIIVSDHGRKGFANCFCLSVNGFMSPTMVFASSPMFLCLRPWSESCTNCFYLFANSFMSPTMVFASSPMFLSLRPLSLLLRQRFLSFRQPQGVSDHCLFFIDHGRYACEHCLRVCDHAFPFPERNLGQSSYRRIPCISQIKTK
jgi:hypothetical protein